MAAAPRHDPPTTQLAYAVPRDAPATRDVADEVLDDYMADDTPAPRRAAAPLPTTPRSMARRPTATAALPPIQTLTAARATSSASRAITSPRATGGSGATAGTAASAWPTTTARR
jgi:hypothetical protein